MPITEYSIEVEVIEGDKCHAHKRGDKFSYPDDSGDMCPWLLDSVSGYQGPVNEPAYADAGDYYHLHLEFYPPLRGASKVKYYASSEMGAWAACNPLLVEDTAALLRTACRGARCE